MKNRWKGRRITRVKGVIYGALAIAVVAQIFSWSTLRYKNILCRHRSRYDADAPAYKHYAYRSGHVDTYACKGGYIKHT